MAMPPVPEKPYLVGSVTDTSLTIAWKVESNSRITHYEVFFRTVDEHTDETSLWESYQTPDTSQECEISSLNPGTAYQFRVVSCAGEMQSRPGGISDSIRTSSREIHRAPSRSQNTPPLPYTNPLPVARQGSHPHSSHPEAILNIREPELHGQVTESSIPVSWSVIGDTRLVHHYTLSCRKADGTGPLMTYDIDKTSTFCRAEDLRAGTKYKFFVTLFTETGWRQMSEESNVFTTCSSLEISEQILHGQVSESSIPVCLKSNVFGDIFAKCNSLEISEQILHGQVSESSIPVCLKSNVFGDISAACNSPDTPESSEDMLPLVEKPTLASSVSHNSVPLTWNVIGNSRSIVNYDVSYRKCDGQQGPLMTVTTKGPENKHTVEDLDPDTRYRFSVCINYGSTQTQSPPSEPSDVMKTSKAPSAVLDEKAFPSPLEPTLSGVVGQFSVPLCWKVNGDTSHVIHYIITYRKTSCESPWMVFETSSPDMQCIVRGLDSETTYEFRVAANTARGQSPPSEASEAITTAAGTESKIPPRPLKPNVDGAVTPESIPLIWKVEANSIEVTHYTVGYMPIDKQKKNKWVTIETDDAKKYFTVADLEAGTSYIFRARSNTSECSSLPSENSDVITTLEEPSGIPKRQDGKARVQTPLKPKLRGTPGHRSIPLEWEVENNMDITHFTLSYRKSDSEKRIWFTFETQDAGKQLTVTGLEPDTAYVFRVAANTKNGQTRPSDVSEAIRTQLNQPCKLVQVGPPVHNSLTLAWTIDGDSSEVTHYTLTYRAIETEADTSVIRGVWYHIETENAESLWIRISGLEPLTTYECMIAANTKDGRICKADSAEVFTTAADPEIKTTSQHQATSDDSKVRVACPIPSKPWLAPDSKPTQTTLPIVWEVNMEGTEITHFTLLHKVFGENRWKKVEIPEVKCQYTLQGLQPGRAYSVRILSNTLTGSRVAGPIGGPFKTESRTETQMYHDLLVSKSRQALSDTGMSIFQVPLRLAKKNEAERIHKFEFNTKPIHKAEKIILVLGETGAGKSTLINGLLNHILGVEWSDDVRFRLVEESGRFEDQYQSQTRGVTVYTLHHHRLFTVPYTVTIIDTPGFGDTQGIEKDKLIPESITHLFKGKEYGIDHIDAIGLVVQSSYARLTNMQNYVFDSILSLFGKDIGDNFFLLITFSDSQKPPVLASAKEAKIPFKSHFKFNNSALFAWNDTGENEFDSKFWKMGAQNFKKFFDELEVTEGKSLYLTKQVLDERRQLEERVEAIRVEIRNGLTKLEQYRIEVNVVNRHEAIIERNKNFEYTVQEIKMKKVDLEPGQYVTNCLTCNRTCHYLCTLENDGDKEHCDAMDQNGFCQVCPNKCIWNLHRNVPFRIELETVLATKTAEDLKARYEKAKGEKMNAEKLTNELLDDFSNLQGNVANMADEVRRGLERLSEIALRPNPLSTAEYVELMIRSEEVEGKPGFSERIKQLEGVKVQAAILNEMAAEGYDPFSEYREELKKVKDAKDRPSFQKIVEGVGKQNPSWGQKLLRTVKGVLNIK